MERRNFNIKMFSLDSYKQRPIDHMRDTDNKVLLQYATRVILWLGEKDVSVYLDK